MSKLAKPVKSLWEEMTPAERLEAEELARLHYCKCGEVTLGGSDISFPDGKATFTKHTHKEE
jgi:hypothetical protein